SSGSRRVRRRPRAHAARTRRPHRGGALMAWGGGGMFGGGGGGFGPPGGRPAGNPGNGLPFAGIPWELQAGVDKLLASEPDHPQPTVQFTHRRASETARRLTLRGLIFAHWEMGLLALLFVGMVSVFNQVGPRLIDLGLHRGIEQ